MAQADGCAADVGVIEVCLNGRRRVAVHPGFDATTLRQVISLLEGLA